LPTVITVAVTTQVVEFIDPTGGSDSVIAAVCTATPRAWGFGFVTLPPPLTAFPVVQVALVVIWDP